MAPFTAGFTDSPMQIVDSFQGFHRFLWRGRGHRQDNHLETDQHRTVQRHPATVPAARDVDHHLRLWLKRESTAWVSRMVGIPSRFASRRVVNPSRWGFLPHHDQHIAALQADKLFGKAKARAVHHVRRQANTAEQPGGVFGEDPEAPIPKIPTGARR